MTRPFSSDVRAELRPATLAKIEKSVEAFRAMLLAVEAGDSAEADLQQRTLYKHRVAVRIQNPADKPRRCDPVGIYPLDPPRACCDDGAPLDLLTVHKYAESQHCGPKFVMRAIECGWVPCFQYGNRLLVDPPTADRALLKFVSEFGMAAVDSNAHRIPVRREPNE